MALFLSISSCLISSLAVGLATECWVDGVVEIHAPCLNSSSHISVVACSVNGILSCICGIARTGGVFLS